MPDNINLSDEVKDMLKKLAASAGKEGARAALEEDRKKQKKDAKKFRDLRLRNTRLLIENYRRLKEHAETAVYSSMQEEVEDIVTMMWDPSNRSEQQVFSIKSSATKTGIIMAHVTAELEQYRKMCYRSPNAIARDRVDALFARYIDENEKTVVQIAMELAVDVRTVQRYIQTAIDDVAAFMFGIDGIVVEEDDFNDDYNSNNE